LAAIVSFYICMAETGPYVVVRRCLYAFFASMNPWFEGAAYRREHAIH
jgi:hypothetical protein